MKYGTDKSTRIVYMALIISWIIIGVGIWFVFFKTNPHKATWDTPVLSWDTIDTVAWEKRYYIDQWVILRWTIQDKDEFGEYSHTFTDSDGNIFGLKSASTDLYEYTWEVSIKWTVAAFADKIPVIQVEDIVSETLDEIAPALEASEWVTYIPEAWLLIDLSPTQGFTIEQSNEEINVVDISSGSPETVLSITSFGCDASSNLTDCETLSENFKSIGAESFVSSRWITYTNMTETNTWLAFDGQWRWYYIRPTWEKNLTTFVDLISFTNDATLTEAIQEEVSSTCKTLEAKIWETYKLSSSTEWDGLLNIRITWESEDGKSNLVCTYQATLWHSPRFKHISTVVQALDIQEEEEDTEEQSEEEIEEEVWEDGWWDEVLSWAVDWNTAKVVDEWEYEGQLSFSSTRGYTLYFSDKGVWYAWSYLAWDDVLTVWDTSCTYWVKVTSRGNIDNIATWADSIIYECTGAIELANLPAWITYLQDINNKHFLKKDITDTYAGMEVWIVANTDE